MDDCSPDTSFWAAIVVIALVFVAYEVAQRRAAFNRMAAIDEITSADMQVVHYVYPDEHLAECAVEIVASC